MSKDAWDKMNTFCECQITEEATRAVLWKKVFLEISENSQENTRARVSFLIKLQASRAVSTALIVILKTLFQGLPNGQF